jgi:hypothetical protein
VSRMDFAVIVADEVEETELDEEEVDESTDD